MRIKHLARILLALWALWGMYYVGISHNEAVLPNITVHGSDWITTLALVGFVIGIVAIILGIFSLIAMLIEEPEFWNKKLF